MKIEGERMSAARKSGGGRMTHSIFLAEEVPFCNSQIHEVRTCNFDKCDCFWEWQEPDCFDYVPRETESGGLPVLCSPCERIRWKTVITSKQYKNFEYIEFEGIMLGGKFHPYDQITTLIIDSEYYIGGPEVEG